jgi:arylsulfatase
MKRKNIVLIMSDEQSWNTLGCFGNSAAVTPNIDALANRGYSFDHCYTPYPLCCPSRTSFWTGLMPRHHHVSGNWRSIKPDLKDQGLISPFKEAGYHTLYTGKWHVPGTNPQRFHVDDASAIPAILGGKDRGRFIKPYRDYAAEHGYELLPDHIENLTANEFKMINQPGKAPCGTSDIPLEHNLETWQTGQFLDALDRRPADKPFFATVSYNAPHFPMVVPSPYDQLISPDDVILPPNFCTGIEGKPQEVFNSKFFAQYSLLDEKEWRKLIAHYLGFCSLIDTQVGRVVSHLKEIGEYENTIFVFVSDHGDMMGAHGLLEKGHLLHYEEALRVPLVISNPEYTDPQRLTQLISLIDVLPTLADMVGVDISQSIDGKSLVPIIQNPIKRIRDYVIAETFLLNDQDGDGGSGEYKDLSLFDSACDHLNLSITTKEDKYIFRWNDHDEFYDLVQDPYENSNLINQLENDLRIQLLREKLVEELAATTPRLAEQVRERIGI